MARTSHNLPDQAGVQLDASLRGAPFSAHRFLSSLWFPLIATTSAILIALSVAGDLAAAQGNSALYSLLVRFQFGGENNIGALWSGALLLVAGVHAFDGWSLNRFDRPKLAAGWLSLSLILVILSLDEVGSLHERVNLLIDESWIDLLPFALVLLALFAHVSYSLLAYADQRRAYLWILGAFGLFATVAFQEYIETRLSWPGYWRILRTNLEEGTEVIAMLILIRVTVTNSVLLMRGSGSFRPGVLSLTNAITPSIVPAFVILAPAAAWITAMLPDLGRGRPADWLTASAFFLAALIPIQRSLLSMQLSLGRILLVAACILGALSTTVEPLNAINIASTSVSKRLVVLLGASALTLFALQLEKQDQASAAFSRRSKLAIAAAFCILILFFFFGATLELAFLLPSWIAIATYMAIASLLATTPRST